MDLRAPEETAVIRTRRIEDLMAEAGLTEQWQALCAGQSEPCGSPWLVSRALEAYSHGWVGAHVVADLLGQDVETTKNQLVAQGWAEPDAYTRLAAGNSFDLVTLIAASRGSGTGKCLDAGRPTADRRRGDANRYVECSHACFRRQIRVCAGKLSQDVTYVPRGYPMLTRDDTRTAVV